MSSRQALGRRGESLARRHLQKIGYSVLYTNYRAGSGEIDLVAEKDGVLVFVEVRTRSGRALGSPEESITSRKRARLVDTAQEYLQENHAEQRQWRIDLVAIEMRPDGRLDRLDVLQNAVEV